MKTGEINIYNNHNFNQISGVNKQNYVGENKANDNFIYIFYDYKNFEEKCLLKKGKIIDNIDMNNETELSYENNKKINIILNNSLINTFKLDETIVVNKDNKSEHEEDPQMQDQQQPINDIPINSKKEIKNNSNINAINNLKDAMKITIPIPNRMGGTFQQNFRKNFGPENEKFKTEIKLGDVNNNNKNEQNLENIQALNNLLDNRTTKSRTIKIDFKENSINPSELSVLNNPTVKSVYQQA